MKKLSLTLGALVLGALCTHVASADEIKGSVSFADTTNNNSIGFTGTFAHPTFDFTTHTYTDSLSIDPSGSLFSTGTDNIQVALTFTLPNAATGDLNGTGTIDFVGIFKNNDIDWDNGGIETINFNDGTVVTASLADFDFLGRSAQSEDLTLTQTPGTSPVPEPGSLALLGTGVLAAAGAIRRRLMA